jgi:hypothetical protein
MLNYPVQPVIYEMKVNLIDTIFYKRNGIKIVEFIQNIENYYIFEFTTKLLSEMKLLKIKMINSH